MLNSSPDKDEVPNFTKEEVKQFLKEMSKNKAPGPDEITSDVISLGGGEKAFLNTLQRHTIIILKTKTIPSTWEEAKN